MTIIDADKFLAYLIFSKHIDGLNCGEVKKVIEMCKVDVLDKIENSVKADGDLISRQAVIYIVEFECGEWKGLAKTIVKAINELPSAENTAEWLIVGKTTLHYECSKCGGAGDKWDKFCKHCGARMKKETEGAK